MKRIHIVGCGPRSGTTLLTELMCTCFEIDQFTEHEDSIYKLPPKKSDIYLTKNPSDILRVGSVLKVMSDLHVIYMVRDPRDMVVSRHNSNPSRYWSGLRFWKTYTPWGRALENHPRFMTICYEDLVTKPDQVQADLIKRYRSFLKKEEHRIRLAHKSGASGTDVCTQRSTLLDVVLHNLFA
ncbi:MAG: sulfotransferase, partial [Verrucomicrobiota bacterium]